MKLISKSKRKKDVFKDKAMFIAHELHKKIWPFIVNVIR
jgi:hypothetical protein